MDRHADIVEDYDEVSVVSIDDDEIMNPDSECDSGLSSISSLVRSNSNSGQLGLGLGLPAGMMGIGEGSDEFRVITKSFVSGMGQYGNGISVVSVHKNLFSSLTGKARAQSFRAFADAVAQKGGGSANIQFGWFGGTMEEISQIVSHGFSSCGSEARNGDKSYGSGVHLSPAKLSIDSALAAAPDENGLRHVLLCRVILGNMEMIAPGSSQSCPSSEEFDTGIDSLSYPRKYIVWSPYMNSHIFPNYVVSFRSPPFRGVQRVPVQFSKPNSPWMSFPLLLSMLSRLLHPREMALVNLFYKRYRERKCSRSELIQKLRQVAGDSTLATIIKCCRNEDAENRVGLRAAFRSFMSGA